MDGSAGVTAPTVPRAGAIPGPVTPQRPHEALFGPEAPKRDYPLEPGQPLLGQHRTSEAAPFGISTGFGGQSRIPEYRSAFEVHQSPLGNGNDGFQEVRRNLERTSVMRATPIDEKIPEAAWKGVHPFPNLNLDGKKPNLGIG